MKFDLRLPIGLLFSFYGVLLFFYGLATNGSKLYERSLNLNINLIWGLVMLAFGLAMFWFSWRARRRSRSQSQSQTGNARGE